MASHQPRHHFLVVALGLQSHINPARHLSLRLSRAMDTHISIAIPRPTLTKMFPSSKTEEESNSIADEEQESISYIPYSDGSEDGLHPGLNVRDIPAWKKHVAESLGRIMRNRGITCVIHTLFLPMAAEVARDLDIPSVLFWIQPPSLFAIYYHYYLSVDIDSSRDLSFLLELPGLPRLQIGDLPQFLTANYATNSDNVTNALDYLIFSLFQDLFLLIKQNMSTGSTTKVLINTFYDLEPTVLSSFKSAVEMIPIGPLVSLNISANSTNIDLFEQDKSAYMDWLDAKDPNSVVYVSFGSHAVLSKKQTSEIFKGLEESGIPYIWVVRKDTTGVSLESMRNGMTVEWCNQMRVLSHCSIGCFVSHCGWNSTVESLASGVPMVTMPQWSDQGVNSKLGEERGVGVRAVANQEDGVVEAAELKRCVKLVMGDEEMRRAASAWKEKAREAMAGGGSSDQNLTEFLRGF